MTDIKWGFSGEEARVKTVQYDAQVQAAKDSRGPDEFFLREGETTRLLFLDDLDFFYHRHMLPDGKRYVPYTCLTETGNCPLCKANKSKSWVGCATVIDLDRSSVASQNAKNPGRVYAYNKLVIAAKGEARNRLLYLRENMAGGSLKFSIIKFHRTSSTKNSSLGESIDFVKTVDLEWIKAFAAKHLKKALEFRTDSAGKPMTAKEWLSPYDYYKIFAMLDPARLAAVAGIPYNPQTNARSIGNALDDLDGVGGLGSDDDLGLDGGFDSNAGNSGDAGGDDDLLGADTGIDDLL